MYFCSFSLTALDELVVTANLLLEFFDLFLQLEAPPLASLIFLDDLVVLQVVLCYLAENCLECLGLDVQIMQLPTDFVDGLRQLFP